MSESQEDIENLIHVNLRAPVTLTHALLPRLKAAKGKIVFISSVISNMPCPDYAVYGATKSAIDSFARNLRIELEGIVSVQAIHPGATRTGMHAKMGLSKEKINILIILLYYVLFHR